MPIEVLVLVFGILILIGGTIVTGQWLSLKKPREADEEIRRLTGEMESLRNDVELLAGSMRLLKERVDFAERVLLPAKMDRSPSDEG